MSKKQKLLNKLLTGSRSLRFEEFILLLQAFGFVLDRISGSHHIFKHDKIQRSFPIQPLRGQAKAYQILQFLTLVEQYQLHMATNKTDETETESDEE